MDDDWGYPYDSGNLHVAGFYCSFSLRDFAASAKDSTRFQAQKKGKCHGFHGHGVRECQKTCQEMGDRVTLHHKISDSSLLNGP